jgi:hypothetical protein
LKEKSTPVHFAGIKIMSPFMPQENEKSEATDPQWNELERDVQLAIKIAWERGMPPMSSALYGRWWQLETWLRSLVYVELRASKGLAWVDKLPKNSESRQQGEQALQYMVTPDAQDRLAYTDASCLFNIMQDHWDYFKSSLLPKNVWAGRVEELLAIRNRIGHCRRPHDDDLARLEQTLRDINSGAVSAITTFNRRFNPGEDWTDNVVNSWVHMHHPTAVRLINHADRQYETSFRLQCSRRPWSEHPIQGQTINGVPGYIWHANWYFRGGRPFDLRGFWRDIEPFRDVIIMVCADSSSSIDVSFSALDDEKIIVDIIGHCFDVALYNLRHGYDTEDYIQWRERYADLDPRVQAGTPWSSIEESMQGISVFGA